MPDLDSPHDSNTPATANRAVRITRFGGPKVIAVAEIDTPYPAPDEVLVRVHAASVNPVDWKTAEGKYPPVGADKLPIVLGRDLAGTIAQVEGADWSVGDRVFAFIGQDRGAQSDFVCVKTSELVAMPDGIDFDAAAGSALAVMTAWQGLFDHGGLTAGQRVLIHGGAGGVGHMAVQLARWKGATVFATASERDLDFVRGLGADTVIDYKNQRFEDIATDLDMVFDTQGGETQARSFGVIREGGILVSTLEPDAAKAAEHKVRIEPRWHAEPDAATLGQVADLLASDELQVTVAKTFPLDQVRAAHAFAQDEHPRGKVVLRLA
ncbi:NADP-dependent oxidoreductase [Sphingomonas glacialis]|uniref:NADP-dependent oxidoreductase n=1 Tax=Sphingomonas glacialis TaxID=658225 RepID=A0A502FR28_9SPHN|nr:NADP-dependent oxidoreductase [Sphingomonas glacialis]TPG51606.1 NADP-dependent oxidoreductase [Sphingomonas glacialis]